MSDPFGTAGNYDELRAVLRAVAETRKISRQELDAITGLPKGFASKVLAEVPIKRLGPDTIGPMLWGLGVKLAVVDDPKAREMFTETAAQRTEFRAQNAYAKSAAVIVKISRRKLSKIGRKGGKRSRANMSERKATALARKAGRNSRRNMTKQQARELSLKALAARWHKPSLIEITPPKTQ